MRVNYIDAVRQVKALLCSAWMTVDSVIASITGLDQSKYAEYEPTPEEYGPSSLKERDLDSLGGSSINPACIAAPPSQAFSTNGPHVQQEV